jgi:hypothetical protein
VGKPTAVNVSGLKDQHGFVRLVQPSTSIALMGMFAETTIVDYHLSFADQGKQMHCKKSFVKFQCGQRWRKPNDVVVGKFLLPRGLVLRHRCQHRNLAIPTWLFLQCVCFLYIFPNMYRCLYMNMFIDINKAIYTYTYIYLYIDIYIYV